QKERKKIYFLTGHGERSGAQERRGFKVAQKALKTEGYEVADLNLLKEGGVPKGAAVVIMAAPQKDLLPNEVGALQNYLEQGGRVYLLLEPYHDAGLQKFLAGYGVNLDNGIIFELNQLTVDRAILSPIVSEYNPHRITENFSLITLFPGPRPLFLNDEIGTATLTPLVTTSASSWEKLGRDWKEGKEGKEENQALYDPKQDKKGPFTIAALAAPKSDRKAEDAGQKPGKPGEKKSPAPSKSDAEQQRQAYLAVFGDADFAADEFFNQLGNGDLFLNTVNFLAAEEKQIIIRQPDKKFEPFLVTGWTTWLIFIVSVVLLPLAMLTAGLAAYMRRRARR
ncbi:MAG: GldG family protein, partial [Thermodesulfobacteriota bacterium]